MKKMKNQYELCLDKIWCKKNSGITQTSSDLQSQRPPIWIHYPEISIFLGGKRICEYDWSVNFDFKLLTEEKSAGSASTD